MQMKKAAILSITAFYLLLTTGMFVCVMHCAAEKLFDKPGMSMPMGASMAHNGKHCTHGNDCGCCKNHGTFTIKENLKPGFSLSFVQTATVLHPVQIPVFLFSTPVYIKSHSWADVNAPPRRSGKYLSIQIRSLLI